MSIWIRLLLGDAKGRRAAVSARRLGDLVRPRFSPTEIGGRLEIRIVLSDDVNAAPRN